MLGWMRFRTCWLAVLEASRSFGKLLNAARDLWFGDLPAGEVPALRVGKTRQDDAAKIEHEGVGERHHRHVTQRASRRAEEADNFVLPSASSQFDEVLRRRVCVVVVDRCRD